MTTDALITMIRAHRADLARLGVAHLRVFGSVASGISVAASDVDLLVEFEGPATFSRYMELKFLLEDAVGRKVDLVTSGALRPEMRERIEREAVRVA